MSKAKTKFLALTLVLIIGVSTVLSGCGKKSTESAAKVDDKNLPPVELSWYFIGNGQQEDVTAVENAVNDYIKDKINATIKLHCYDWGSYDEKIKTMIASGEEFDICFTCSWSNNYREKAIKGAFVPLNDMFDKYAPKTKELLGDDFLAGSLVNGDNYFIPANKEKAHQWGFIIREDLAKKYNFDLSTIKKLEDIEPMLKVIKEKEPGIYPLGMAGKENPFRALDFDQLDGDNPIVMYNDSKDMKVFNKYEAPETKKYFDTMHKFFNAGYIRKDAATVSDSVPDESAGKVFATVTQLKPGKDKEKTLQTKQPWVQVAITNPVMSNYDTVGSMQAISRTSKNPERALMFLELFNTDKYVNNLINFGIENKHYVKVSDNVIKAGPDNKKYNPGTTWMFGNVFINYLWENEDINKWDNFKKFNEEAVPTKSLGFLFDTSSVKNEVAACTAAAQDYEAGLQTGTLDPDVYLPKLLKALKDAGIDKVQTEAQSQLDKWLQTKK